MSVVADFSLIDGVLLGSDCRVTVEPTGCDALHADCAQKVIPISDHSKEVLLNSKKLRTVKQIAESRPAFTEASLRWMIFRSDVNGMDQVLVRVGRRVLVDTQTGVRESDFVEATTL